MDIRDDILINVSIPPRVGAMDTDAEIASVASKKSLVDASHAKAMASVRNGE